MIMLHVLNENMQIWMETIKLANLGPKKLHKGTN